MKSYNIAVEFTSPSFLDPDSSSLCMLSFSLQDDTDPSKVVEFFQRELLFAISFARSTKAYVPASTAILKAAKRVQEAFHCKSFMLEADGKLSFNLC